MSEKCMTCPSDLSDADVYSGYLICKVCRAEPDDVDFPPPQIRAVHTVKIAEAAHEAGRREREAEIVDRSYRKSADTTIEALTAALEDAKAAINRDRTGLAGALAAIVAAAKGAWWVTEGRGPYRWNDDEYRKEAGRALQSMTLVAAKALRASGDLADAEFRAVEAALVLARQE